MIECLLCTARAGHGLAYWLVHGSLLSAWRELGAFIPWDHDGDVAVEYAVLEACLTCVGCCHGVGGGDKGE